MHSNNQELSKEIDSIINKFLDESKIEENMSDEFFDELKNAIDRHKNKSYNKIQRDIRKRKIKKINNNNEENN
jgi:predicted nucleic acid-binding protein